MIQATTLSVCINCGEPVEVPLRDAWSQMRHRDLELCSWYLQRRRMREREAEVDHDEWLRKLVEKARVDCEMHLIGLVLRTRQELGLAEGGNPI